MANLQAIRYARGRLQVLNQLRLPHEFCYDDVSTSNEAYDCIVSMHVRGAPAIAIVAILVLAVQLHNQGLPDRSASEALSFVEAELDYLQLSRPTAVDLTNAIARMKKRIRNYGNSKEEIMETYIHEAENILADDLKTNLRIGLNGAQWLAQKAGTKINHGISVLTHCNTGSLATSGHGTALGIIRTLQSQSVLRHVYCTETRPYNQGSRLTAFELVYEGIPSTLITDSMAASLFRTKKASMNIAAVIVGADRVTRNGDTANKIGTYQLAVLAKHHGIRFIVAAPTTSLDLGAQTGNKIRIEERRPEEVTQITGATISPSGQINKSDKVQVAIADQKIGVWNPAFDVTPAALIDVIVTEKGVFEQSEEGTFDLSRLIPDCLTAQRIDHLNSHVSAMR